MNTIKRLDDVTISKIAAGEVIDRPASIVKECIENAIDAGSTAITISVADGGKQLIRITDNGHGIHKQDLPLAPIRHATSKITSLDDIYQTLSFGFRGEALASICHCAKLTIFSKQHEAPAYKLTAFLDDISTPSLCSHHTGTTLEIKDLFSNLPVRQQFLKSATTELSYISEIVTHFSLIFPEIDFILISNDKEKINTSGISQLDQLIIHFYGKQLKDKLSPVDFTMGPATFKGYISDPTFTFSNRSKQVVAINHRLVKNAIINKAIQDGFRDLIAQRRFPLVILNISMDQSTIDVNIHPQKQDIKFLSPGFIFDMLPKAISISLQENHSHTDLVTPFALSESSGFTPQTSVSTPFTAPSSEQPFVSNHDDTDRSFSYPPVFKKEAIDPKVIDSSMSLFSKSSQQSTSTTAVEIEFFQLFKTYIAIKSTVGLYIVDQHAVHERILYEKIKDDFGQVSEKQVLLLSEIIDLSPDLYLTFESHQQTLSDLNFTVEPFGHHQIAIREIPVPFIGASVKDLILDILEQFKKIPGSNRDLILDQKDTLQRKACRAAIKAGQQLSEFEIKQLIKDFIQSPSNFTCPHGRPLFLHFDKDRLESLFLRK